MKLDQDLVVTCFSSAHAEAVSSLIQGSLAEALAEPEQNLEAQTADSQPYSKEQIIRHMNERLTYVAVYRQRIVGAILLGQADAGREVEAICVAPEYRDEGIGAMLVKTAEQRAGELGVKRISVSPKLKDNGFFRKLGYQAAQGGLAKALA